MAKKKNYYCSKCKEDIEEKVYDYSIEHFGKVFCRDCQGGNDEKKEVVNDKKKWNPESMIKGRIAETLIEELFLSLGYNVFRYSGNFSSSDTNKER